MASPFKDDQPLDAPLNDGMREVHGRASGARKPEFEGDALLSAGRFEEALAACRASLKRHGIPVSETVYLKRKMAVALQSLARPSEALEVLDEARDLAVRSGLT